MALAIGNVTFDSLEPLPLADFWAATMGYEKEEDSDNEGAAIRDPRGKGPRFFFQRVAEPKRAKNRLHLDLDAGDMDAEVERLVGLGARKVRLYQDPPEIWTVMEDPEGNEFCVQPGG